MRGPVLTIVMCKSVRLGRNFPPWFCELGRETMFPPSDLTAKRDYLEDIKNKEADHPELETIKEDTFIAESEFEVAIKHEPLHWYNNESVEDVKFCELGREPMFPPSDLTAKSDYLEVIIKNKEEADHPELDPIKEEKVIEESECEVAIKHEPLHLDKHEPVEDVNALGGAVACSSGSCSPFAGELSACPSVLGGDGGVLVMALENGRNKLTSSEQNSRVKSFVCGSCEYRTNIKYNLVRHSRIHHSVRVKQFVCSSCEYKTDNKRTLKDHLRRHESFRVMPFACNHCPFRSDWKCSLTAHLCRHEQDRYKPFACNHCQYRTDVKRNLIEHLSIRENGSYKPFACNHCQYRTSVKKNHLSHLRTHESVRDKPFACNHCTYKSDKKRNLKEHLRIHESVRDKPFACNHCQYQTDVKRYLVRHRCIHKSVKI